MNNDEAVDMFAEAMKHVLRKHGADHGEKWKTMSLQELKEWIDEEYVELDSDWQINRDYKTPHNLVSLANMCALLWVKLWYGRMPMGKVKPEGYETTFGGVMSLNCTNNQDEMSFTLTGDDFRAIGGYTDD
jgi:hypothetical protein